MAATNPERPNNGTGRSPAQPSDPGTRRVRRGPRDCITWHGRSICRVVGGAIVLHPRRPVIMKIGHGGAAPVAFLLQLLQPQLSCCSGCGCCPTAVVIQQLKACFALQAQQLLCLLLVRDRGWGIYLNRRLPFQVLNASAKGRLEV